MSLDRVSAICLATLLVLSGCLGSDSPSEDDSGDSSTVPAEVAYEGDDAGECVDDADNDRDGLFDCQDPNCQGSVACPVEIPGCIYDNATNFDANATIDDGSCTFFFLTQDDIDAAYDEGYAGGVTAGYNQGYAKGVADTAPVSTLDTILARGFMKCGVKESQFGMGYLSEDGVRSGLDIEYCRAVAAAIGLNPDTDITYVPASSSDRFEKLASGVIDVLIRTTTWTTSRDAGLNADFAGINFYDGQGILISENSFTAAAAGNSVSGLDGAKICVGTGTTTEGNLADYFTFNNIDFTAINVENAEQATEKFFAGECDAFTGDMSAMVARKWFLDQDTYAEGDALYAGTWIAKELLSKEPLGAATRDNDDDWNDVVQWVWFGMLTAEEFGVDSANYAAEAAAAADGGDPGISRLLNYNLGLGTTANPLAATWMQSVLGAVGNYGEAYDRSFCDGDGGMNNCLIDRAGTANAPYWEGGLQYAPPMR